MNRFIATTLSYNAVPTTPDYPTRQEVKEAPTLLYIVNVYREQQNNQKLFDLGSPVDIWDLQSPVK